VPKKTTKKKKKINYKIYKTKAEAMKVVDRQGGSNTIQKVPGGWRVLRAYKKPVKKSKKTAKKTAKKSKKTAKKTAKKVAKKTTTKKIEDMDFWELRELAKKHTLNYNEKEGTLYCPISKNTYKFAVPKPTNKIEEYEIKCPSCKVPVHILTVKPKKKKTTAKNQNKEVLIGKIRGLAATLPKSFLYVDAYTKEDAIEFIMKNKDDIFKIIKKYDPKQYLVDRILKEFKRKIEGCRKDQAYIVDNIRDSLWRSYYYLIRNR